MKHLFIYLSCLLVLSTCVKPYEPEIKKYERVIVIDATLTDNGRPPVVQLSYSRKVGGPDQEKISGALVTILSSDGNKYQLAEQSKGTYTYTLPMFPVTIGTAYQLVVEHEGNVFRSSMEKLLPACPISDISFQPKDDLSGVDLLFSTDEVDTASRYYLWKLTETWKFRTPIYSVQKSVNKDLCYATARDELRLGTTELFARNKFTRYPFLFIPASQPQLCIRYSILVEQLSVSRSTYMYLNHVKKTNELAGSLFDPIPANMNGNITSETAPVIGNFQVSSLKSKRIYIDRSDLPRDMVVSAGMEECRLEVASLEAATSRYRDSLADIMIVMDTISEPSGLYVRFTTSEYCYDCTAAGAPNKAPSWWEEKK